MSQDNVEKILGRMITDRDFFESCRNSLATACLEQGLFISELELNAIQEMDLKQFASLTPVLDSRIIRAGGNLRGDRNEL